MIFDRIENLQKYISLHPAIETVCEMMSSHPFHTLKDSSYETGRDDLWYSISTYQTTREDKAYEYHKKNADLQVMVKGCERCDYSLLQTDLSIDEFEKGDIAFSDADSSGTVFLNEGSFVIFLPGELHRPGLAIDEEEEVRKVVFKLKFD